MEFLLIVGIIIAIFGALTIVAVLRQDNAGRPAAPSIGSEQQPAEAEIAQTATKADNAASAPTAPAAPSTESAPPDEAPLTIESVTALYAHANDNDDVALVDSSLQLNVSQMLATQIERLYDEYLRLEEERTRLAEALWTNLLFEKIERSAGRRAITTERETLNLREQLSKVSAEYHRIQFRLGSLQHLNSRLSDPRVAQQMDDLALEVKRLASRT